MACGVLFRGPDRNAVSRETVGPALGRPAARRAHGGRRPPRGSGRRGPRIAARCTPGAGTGDVTGSGIGQTHAQPLAAHDNL
jgi:hypothetical protein